MDPRLKPVLEREMEVYAAFMEHTDHHVGRMIDSLKEMGELDNTLIYLVIGDNGASAEGTLQGAFNEMANFNGVPEIETPEFMMSKLDEFGGEGSYGHYAVGWAWAMNSPYQWTKQVASHWGGTRNGIVVHWPKGIKEKGGIRNQFCHVIDIAPTVLEAAGLPEPTMVNGVHAEPVRRHEHALHVQRRRARRSGTTTQYFEMFCNRGIYHKGWSAVTKHRTPWEMKGGKLPAFDDDVWELYDGSKDWTQAKNLAKEMPEKLHELQRLWLIEAVKFNVLPLDDRQIERFVPELAGRPTLIKGNTQTLYAGMGRLSENSVITHQEQVVRGHLGSGSAGEGRRGRDHCPGRPVRRLEPLRQGRQGQVPLQHAGHQAIRHRGHHAHSDRQDAGAHGVRLRRRRHGQGRHRHALL